MPSIGKRHAEPGGRGVDIKGVAWTAELHLQDVQPTVGDRHRFGVCMAVGATARAGGVGWVCDRRTAASSSSLGATVEAGHFGD